MRHLTIDELECERSQLEAAVDATPGVDPWCSGPDWQLPVALAFAPTAGRLLLSDESATGFLLLTHHRSAGGPVLGGLEPLWGFGSPVLGPDPGGLVAAAVDELAAVDWRAMVLPGQPPLTSPTGTGGDPGGDPDSERTTLPTALALSELGQVGLGEGITRQVIDLGGGYDAWLGRRSPRFRRNLRRAQAAAAEAGLHIVDVATDAADDLFERLLAIERRSWKGREGSGITGLEMAAMYRAMIARLRSRGRLLAFVAMLDGRDVGYILGGVRVRRYRGLQLSFTADAGRLSVGNLLQAHQLRRLVEDDRADVYDLGMDFGYKRRWADRAETSVTLVVRR